MPRLCCTINCLITGEGLKGQISIVAYDYAAGTEALTFQAGKPYSITAQYSGDEDTLFMFTVYNKNQELSYLNYYTTGNSIVFIPSKQDEFVITARIINVKSFGYKDISKNITINS